MKKLYVTALTFAATLSFAASSTNLNIQLQSVDWKEKSGDNSIATENTTIIGSGLGLGINYDNPNNHLKAHMNLLSGQSNVDWHLERLYYDEPTLHAKEVATHYYELEAQRTYDFAIKSHSSPIEIQLGIGLGYWQQRIDGGASVFDDTSISLVDRQQSILYLPVSLEIKKSIGRLQPFANLTYNYWIQGWDEIDFSSYGLNHKTMDQPDGFGATASLGMQYAFDKQTISLGVTSKTWLIDFSNTGTLLDDPEDGLVVYHSGKKLFESTAIQAAYHISL